MSCILKLDTSFFNADNEIGHEEAQAAGRGRSLCESVNVLSKSKTTSASSILVLVCSVVASTVKSFCFLFGLGKEVGNDIHHETFLMIYTEIDSHRNR